MSAEVFLGLEIDQANRSAQFEAKSGNCNALGFLYGGAGIAASIETLERITERPLIWMTCQFNNFAKLGAHIDLTAQESVRGRNISHASLDAFNGQEPVFKVLGSFGQRSEPQQFQFIEKPQVDSPENCPHFGGGREKAGTLNSVDSRIEYRVARGRLRKDKKVEGQLALWAKVPEIAETSAASIALAADYLPVSIGSMLEKPAGGNSLDNNLRMIQLEQSEWILLDCEAKAVNQGFGHASMNIWSQSGKLLAIASQSIIFREYNFNQQSA